MERLLSKRRGYHLIRYLTIFVVVVLGAAIFVSPAKAEQPITWEVTITGSWIDTATCSFPITWEYTQTQTLTAFIDSNGGWFMGHHHTTELDKVSANGKTLVGLPYRFNIHNFFEPGPVEPILQGGAFEGIYQKIPLPDGGMFIAAGRFEWDENWNVISVKGNTGDSSRLCAALAP